MAAACWVECMPGQRVGAWRGWWKGEGGEGLGAICSKRQERIAHQGKSQEGRPDHSNTSAEPSRAQSSAQHIMQHIILLHPWLAPKLQQCQEDWVVAHRLKTIRMVAAALVGTKDSQKTPASTVGRALCSLCALGQLSISTYRLGLPVSWSKACRQSTKIESHIMIRRRRRRLHAQASQQDWRPRIERPVAGDG